MVRLSRTAATSSSVQRATARRPPAIRTAVRTLVAAAPALLLLTASACAGARAGERASEGAASEEAERGGARTPHGASPVWTTALDRDHVLVGRVWDVARAEFVGEHALIDALARAPLMILGERHDNPDHHQLQARLLEAVIARERRPAVAFEMLDRGEQPALDRALAEHPGDADALAAAVDWQHSGWPAWREYRPVFAAALAARLPIVAAGLDPDIAMGIAREGAAAVDPQLAQRFGLTAPLSPDANAALQAEMRDAHCGLLPEAMLGAMVLVQRVRDAQFAERLHEAAQGRGGVLITGNGHARTDRGVPAALHHAYGQTALSVGLLEVQREWQAPPAYAAAFGAAQLPFDYVWFTPRASDDDPCAELRARHAH